MATKQVSFNIEVDEDLDLDNLTIKEAFEFQLGIKSSISMDNPYCDLDEHDFIRVMKPTNLSVS